MNLSQKALAELDKACEKAKVPEADGVSHFLGGLTIATKDGEVIVTLEDKADFPDNFAKWGRACLQRAKSGKTIVTTRPHPRISFIPK